MNITNLRSVPDQISEQGDVTPHSVALSYGDVLLTYEELVRSADMFAGYLIQLGVVSGNAVAICMERSFDWIIAALGIMRAGGAYVPLDSAWPDSRLRFAVSDSGATVLVARKELLDRLQVEVCGIDPDRDAEAIAAAPKPESRPIELGSLAYVIYTSGSTGVPKGVEITHANLSHLVRWHRDAFRVTRNDRASHISNLGFDAAVWELWPHLCAGATVCLAEDEARLSTELLQQWMLRRRVTIGFVPTIHAAKMMAMEWPTTTALRMLLTGGDMLHHAPLLKLPFEVVNNYGPTECTVVATFSVLVARSLETPPIGRPIAGASIYVLDEKGERVPDGNVGEIYIGGSGVGRAYRNLPELTAKSFLADPFAPSTASRMYRTGDLGLRRPNGEIEFRGRLDRQTKIRGQRVELDEIANVLARHPHLDYATAIASASNGENHLTAYVLPKNNNAVPTDFELQQHLRERLPEYMIPETFVRLQEIPLSASGKLDLTKLGQPTKAKLVEDAASRAIRGEVGAKLLTIMRELLKNEQFLPDQNFFLAGGHSLLSMQLLTRLQQSFGVEMTLGQLFECPTVERLSVLIETMLRGKRLAVIWAELLGVRTIEFGDSFFDLGGHPVLVSVLQQRIAKEFGTHIPIATLFENPTILKQAELTLRMVKAKPTTPPGVLALNVNGTRNTIFWVHYLSVNLAKVMGYDQRFNFVLLTREDFESLGESPSLARIAQCLLRKILETQPNGPFAIGGFCAGGILAYEIAYQLRAAGHEVSLLVLLDAPNLAYQESHRSLTNNFSYPIYALKRAARLRLRMSLAYLRERLFKRVARTLKTKSERTEMRMAQRMVRSAALAYEPKRYDGNVLLLVASEHSPHQNIIPGWRAVVPRNLHTQGVTGHRRDLLNVPNVHTVAEAITSQLMTTSDGRALSDCSDSAKKTTRRQTVTSGVATV
jgi:amino acid adenylation domain-containing protein